MRVRRFSPLPILVLAVASFASSCLYGQIVADFKLEDVNTTSPRYQQDVSPRDYRHQVSAYYFGSAG